MKSYITLAALAAVALQFAGSAFAHDEDLRSNNLPPRIGQISDEVAVQRLTATGVVNPKVLRREGTRIVVSGEINNQPTTLHMDALRGRVVDATNPSRVIVEAGAAPARTMVTGARLQQPRSSLSAPELMHDAVKVD